MCFPKEIEQFVENMKCVKDSEGMSKADVYRLFDSEKTYYLKVEKRCDETIREFVLTKIYIQMDLLTKKMFMSTQFLIYPKEDKVLSHGDYCFNNYFAENNQVSGYIDMGRGGVGDRYQDIALCVRELMNYEKKYTELLFSHLNIEPDYEKIRYYILLDELF